MYPTASLSISQLLSGPYLLNIPIFQRPYSWGREQAEQLLDDLMEAAGVSADREADHDYFLGAVVLMDSPGVETTKLSPKMAQREFGIIDGQQRLVTLMTLLAVLRDLEVDLRTSVAKRVQRMLFAQQGSRFFRTERFRLHLAGRERVVFETRILQPGSTAIAADFPATSAQEATLLDVRDQFRSTLAEMSGSARKTLAEFIADRCYVVVIVGTDIDRSHQMFVVLNERGKKLQRNDILKSDILSRLTTGDIGWAAQTWDDTSLALGENFEPFFGHLRTIFGHGRMPIVAGVRNIIRDTGGSEAFFRDVFLPYSKAYALIRSCGWGTLPGGMSRTLTYLNRLPDADWAPAAILVLSQWRRDPDRASFLLSEIERLAILTRLLCAGSGKRARRFAELIKAIRAGELLDTTHPVLQVTRDEVRSIAFHLRDLHKRNPKVCRLLLMRLSDEMGDSALNIDPDLYTIEHVLPQRPAASSAWRRSVPSAEERGEIVDCLGNLVLITQQENDKARNASWDEKKKIYGTTASSVAPLLAITRDVLGESEWGRAEIDAREQRLIGLIETLWRIDLKLQRPVSRNAGKLQEQQAKTMSRTA
ncbi:DUF262 domain-containing HNH endonuclease family protein [Hyphomicrobium sp.]|uniref:DUF262 domain-containing protein n=1 Tax=Hyphomicrobium sp. TaxID=82 RepID=UPI002B81FA6E|nr:DUF262 domain-containing HNH endonuclease family protein [Hyphomicrobium sp.]HVZ05674.1 DUF262 domain-containing HNH endonuclease family protein [Hyphomicrobium sp.]